MERVQDHERSPARTTDAATSLALPAAIAGHVDHADRVRGSAREIAEHGFAGTPRELPHRRAMEGLFRQDLAGVQAYMGDPAAAANHAFGSGAYTVGHRIGFAMPDPPPALVAHELTHVHQHANAPHGGSAIDSSGEAEATRSESLVHHHAPMSHAPRRDLVRAASRRVGGPALGGLTPIAGKPGRPTGFRFSDVDGPLGRTRSFELQLFGAPRPTIPVWPPLVNAQIIPELRLLAGDRESANESSELYTLSGRLIFSLTGGVLELAEVFGSITAFVDGQIADTVRSPAPGQSEPRRTLSGTVVLRGTGRVGVRALRRLVEASIDSSTIQVVKVTFKANRVDDRWVAEQPLARWEWNPELLALVRFVDRKIDELRNYATHQLREIGWRPLSESLRAAGQVVAAGAEAASTLAAPFVGLAPAILLNAREKLNPANWDLATTPHFTSLVAQALWSRLEPLGPDRFVEAAARPLGDLGFRYDDVEVVVRELNAAANATRGRPPWTISDVLALKPHIFIQLLVDSKLLRYTRDLDSFAIPTKSNPNPAPNPAEAAPPDP